MMGEHFKGYNKKHGAKSVNLTRFSRVLYGNYGFEVFGAGTTRNAYLMKVFGHKFVDTSLAYGWVKVIMILRVMANINADASQHIAQLMVKNTALEKKIEECCHEMKQQQQVPGQPVAKKDKLTMISLPKVGGGLVSVKKNVWGRAPRAKRGEPLLSASEKKANRLMKYTSWVNTVLIPANVDVTQITSSHATLIGISENTIQEYNRNHK